MNKSDVEKLGFWDLLNGLFSDTPHGSFYRAVINDRRGPLSFNDWVLTNINRTNALPLEDFDQDCETLLEVATCGFIERGTPGYHGGPHGARKAIRHFIIGVASPAQLKLIAGSLLSQCNRWRRQNGLSGLAPSPALCKITETKRQDYA